MATESETHGFNSPKYPRDKNRCRKAIWLTVSGAFLSPKRVRNCRRWRPRPRSHQGRPPEHSPRLMRCETLLSFWSVGRCLRCGTFWPAAIPVDLLLSAACSPFPSASFHRSRQGDLILAADWDPCLKVDRVELFAEIMLSRRTQQSPSFPDGVALAASSHFLLTFWYLLSPAICTAAF